MKLDEIGEMLKEANTAISPKHSHPLFSFITTKRSRS